MKDKIKNPYFWLGIVSIVFAAANIDLNTLTSWQLLYEALISIIQNPVAIIAVIGAVIAVFNDNGSPGLDGIKKAVLIDPEPEDKVKNIAGVCWSKSNNKYKAYIKIDGKQKHLGYYDNLEDAIKARKEAEKLLKGDE